MDINYLLKRQQISLMQASNAKCVEARSAYLGLARGYGTRLSVSSCLTAGIPINLPNI